jgi:hypothetical protein
VRGHPLCRSSTLEILIDQLQQPLSPEARVVSGVHDAHRQITQTLHGPDVVGDIGTMFHILHRRRRENCLAINKPVLQIISMDS